MTNETLMIYTDGTPYNISEKNPSVTEALSKNNIMVPIPASERLGIDLGIISSHTFTVAWTETESTDALRTFKNAAGAESSSHTFQLLYRGSTFNVRIASINTTDDAGQGNIMPVTVTFEVYKP